ncbi:hypothetical protein GCM10027516_09420 [Niabella aquatica]
MPCNTKYEKDIEKIIKLLEEVYKNSIIKEVIQNNNKLTLIFLDGKYSYYPHSPFKVQVRGQKKNNLKQSLGKI